MVVPWVSIYHASATSRVVSNSQLVHHGRSSFLTVSILRLLWLAGRYDIARALEKWGGIQEVSRLLSLEPRRPRKQADPDGESQPESPSAAAAEHHPSSSNADKASVPLDAQKWLLKLKDLDINWVEY